LCPNNKIQEVYDNILMRDAGRTNFGFNDICYIAQSNNIIIGIARRAYLPNPKSYYLESIWTHELYRNNNIASNLIKKILNHNDIEKIWLDCNPLMYNFYIKFDFILENNNMIDKFYEPDCGNIVMSYTY